MCGVMIVTKSTADFFSIAVNEGYVSIFGKSCVAAQDSASQVKLDWVESKYGHVFKITAPALNEEETADAYLALAALVADGFAHPRRSRANIT